MSCHEIVLRHTASSDPPCASSGVALRWWTLQKNFYSNACIFFGNVGPQSVDARRLGGINQLTTQSPWTYCDILGDIGVRFQGRRRTTCSAVPVVMVFVGTTDSRPPGLVVRQSGGITPSSNLQESWHSVNEFYCTCALPSHLKSRHLELEESVNILIHQERAYQILQESVFIFG